MAATPATLPRGLRVLQVVGSLIAAALAAAVLGVLLTGATDPLTVDDAGAITRWGLPVVRVLDDVAAALTVGLLVLAAVALPPNASGRRNRTTAGTAAGSGARPGARPGAATSARVDGPSLALVRLAGVTALVWAAAGGAVLVLSYARLAGVAPGTAGFAEQLGSFITQIDLLRALLVSSLVVVVVATGAIVATRLNTVGWMAVLALGALLPVALTGHAAGALDHELAVDSLAFHLVGVTVWVGGLAALTLVRSALAAAPAGQLVDVVRRYSTLALWAFVAVGASGLVNAWLRLGGWDGLATSYGALVLVKVAALVLLGMAGLAHRRRTIARMAAAAGASEQVREREQALFWRLVGGELVVMGVAIGTAVALANSAPPRAETVGGDAALALTGYPMPSPLQLVSWLSAWRLDLLWTTAALLLLGLYVTGAIRLARRGDHWPVLRTVSWVAGCLVLVWATGGAPGIYGRVLFSAHMTGHMTMSMVVPVLLVLGAPVTLALRTVSARRDGSRGPREWLLAVVHSRVLAVLGHPLVAAGLFAGSLVVFYYSPLFELSLRTHTGHVLMHTHFLLVGYLFASVLIGIDPGPARPPYPMRLLLLFATMAFHAFFGVALVQGTQLLAPDVLGALDRPWGRTPIADQQYGGAVAWGLGELPVLLLGMGIAIAWVRSDDREARRRDRQADRDGDAELTEYNAQLARLAARDGSPDGERDDREVRR